MIYKFNKTEINLQQFEIHEDGKLLSVEPKVFDLITYLIKNRHRIISRDELFEQVWDGRAVSDTSLSNHIKSARKLLGDSGDLQCVIKTIRSRGYQFVASVDENEIDQVIDTIDSNDLNAQPANSINGSFIASLFTNQYHWFILGLASLLVWLMTIWADKDQSSTQTIPTLLVVPFSISSNQPAKWEPFADQFTREMIQGLRKVSGVKTIAPPSSFTFKNNKIRNHIQQQLPDVNYVLDGVVKESADGDIRITVELEDIRTNKLLWDGDFDIHVNSTNRFSIQAQVAESVTKSLKIIMLVGEKQILAQIPTANVAAHDLYVQGRHQLSLMSHNSVLLAIDYFSRAIALDPKFEAPYIAKSNAYRIIMTYFDKPKNVLPKAIASATDVLRINPQSAQVMSLLGLAYVHALQWQEAWDMLSKARQLDPNLVLTELGFALYYSAMGDVAGVKRSLAKADKLDPLNEEIADWGIWALMMVNELDTAIKWGEQKVQLHPNNPYPILGLSVAYTMLGNIEQSMKFAIKGVDLSDRAPLSLIFLAQSYAAAGETAQVTTLMEEAKNQKQYLCPYETAAIYAILEQPKQMFYLLDKAVEYQSNCLIFAKHDPRFEVYRNDIRYINLLKNIGLDTQNINLYVK